MANKALKRLNKVMRERTKLERRVLDSRPGQITVGNARRFARISIQRPADTADDVKLPPKRDPLEEMKRMLGM